MRLYLTPTQLTYNGTRIWLETSDHTMAGHMSYRVKNGQAIIKQPEKNKLFPFNETIEVEIQNEESQRNSRASTAS